MNLTPQLTGGTIATMIVVPLLLLIFVAAFVILCRWAAEAAREVKDREAKAARYTQNYGGSAYENSLHDARVMRVWAWAPLVLIVLTLGLTWWGMYPWNTEYHHWIPKSGVVARVDSRLISSGDGSGSPETKFVVMFTGDQQQYGVNDTRAAGVKQGDRLTITCVRTWQYSGTDGYDCNFIALDHS